MRFTVGGCVFIACALPSHLLPHSETSRHVVKAASPIVVPSASHVQHCEHVLKLEPRFEVVTHVDPCPVPRLRISCVLSSASVNDESIHSSMSFYSQEQSFYLHSLCSLLGKRVPTPCASGTVGQPLTTGAGAGLRVHWIANSGTSLTGFEPIQPTPHACNWTSASHLLPHPWRNLHTQEHIQSTGLPLLFVFQFTRDPQAHRTASFFVTPVPKSTDSRRLFLQLFLALPTARVLHSCLCMPNCRLSCSALWSKPPLLVPQCSQVFLCCTNRFLVFVFSCFTIHPAHHTVAVSSDRQRFHGGKVSSAFWPI